MIDYERFNLGYAVNDAMTILPLSEKEIAMRENLAEASGYRQNQVIILTVDYFNALLFPVKEISKRCNVEGVSIIHQILEEWCQEDRWVTFIKVWRPEFYTKWIASGMLSKEDVRNLAALCRTDRYIVTTCWSPQYFMDVMLTPYLEFRNWSYRFSTAKMLPIRIYESIGGKRLDILSPLEGEVRSSGVHTVKQEPKGETVSIDDFF